GRHQQGASQVCHQQRHIGPVVAHEFAGTRNCPGGRSPAEDQSDKKIEKGTATAGVSALLRPRILRVHEWSCPVEFCLLSLWTGFSSMPSLVRLCAEYGYRPAASNLCPAKWWLMA